MNIEIATMDDVEGAVIATVSGMWNHAEITEAVPEIQRLSPTYLILDPTNAIIVSSRATPLDEVLEVRRKNVMAVIEMMVDNPRMLYFVVNRNKNSAFSSAIPAFEAYGIADRYILVKTLDEALAMIRDSTS